MTYSASCCSFCIAAIAGLLLLELLSQHSHLLQGFAREITHRLLNTLITGCFSVSSSSVCHMRFVLQSLLELSSKLHPLTASMISAFILQSKSVVANPTHTLVAGVTQSALLQMAKSSDWH